MNHLLIVTTCIFLAAASCNPTTQAADTTSKQDNTSDGKTWTIKSNETWLEEAGLQKVESIVHDSVNNCFYLSNGLDYAAGTDGFISKVSASGELLNLHWVDSLNRPTGMAIQDSLLYVADVNVLVLINTNTGQILDRYPEPVANTGLNDVTIDALGTVYVSASFVHAVVRLEEQGLVVWAQDDEGLQWANGVVVHDKQLLVAGMNLAVVNMESKELASRSPDLSIKDFDGIALDSYGGYFLTTVENSGFYYLDAQGEVHQLLSGDDYFGDLVFLPSRQRILIPRGNTTTGDYYISVLALE